MKINSPNCKRLFVIAILGILPLFLMFNPAQAALGIVIDQCQNGSPPVGFCEKWATGILNAHATYFEGMASFQRFLFTGVTGANHTISFDMQWTKAGKHAYDWPVSWEQGRTLSQRIGYFDTNPFTRRCGDYNNADEASCNLAVITQTANVPADPYISGQFGLPATDGTTTGKINAFIPVYGTPQIQLISDQPLTFTVRTPTHNVANLADTGDSKVTYTMDVTGTGVISPTVIQLIFAAHIAISDAPGDPAAPGTTWGQGFGAKNISGAPYHVQQPTFDGSTNSQDNQLALNGEPLSPDLVTRISKTTTQIGTGVSDTVTMTWSSSTVISGYIRFYACGPTASPQPCLPQYTTKTHVLQDRPISTTASSVVASSGNYTPTASGYHCFLAQWINQSFTTQSWETFSTTNECTTISSVTAVTLSSIQASQGNLGAVLLSWATASEVNAAGFNIYRAEKRDGPYTQINSQLIPTSFDKVAGAKYQYQDTTVEPGKTYYYQLEDVELGGTIKRHDPVSVNVPGESAFDLNLLLFGSIFVGGVVVAGGLVRALKKPHAF